MIRTCLRVGAILFTAVLISLPVCAADVGRRLAILIGVNRYSNRNLPDLEFAEQDVQELSRLLTPVYKVRLLLGSATGVNHASKANIVRAFEDLFRSNPSKDDTILIALAGHGQQLQVERNGHKGDEPFFCPRGAVPSDPSTLINLSELIERLAERGGGTNLLMVDACRNDPDPTRGRGIDGELVSQLPAGMAVFLSCSKGEKARESKNAGGGHGLFFHYVLQGMSGPGGRDSQGEVSWDHLVAYVKDRVIYDGPKLLGNATVIQTPRALGNLGRSPILLPQHLAATDLLRRGYAAFREKKYDQAIADYSEAIRVNPQYVTAYLNRSWAYLDKRDNDKAIADATEALRLDPKAAAGYNNRGAALFAKKQYDRAISDYTEAIRVDPKFGLAYRNRARAYASKGDLERCNADLATAVELAKSNKDRTIRNATGFRPLFNGRDLAGWRVDHGDPHAWSVRNGELVVTGAIDQDQRGWLLSDDEFSDFLLRFEFQLTAGGNSGVTIRARPGESRYSNTAKRHIEIQLMDDTDPSTVGKLELNKLTGSLFGLALDQPAKLKPFGEWNTMTIEARDSSLRVVVNGGETLKTSLDRFSDKADRLPALKRPRGRIGFQSWMGTVRFRKIEILPY
jgi:tetratricopeptide (TPR) repeat protein